MSDPKSLAVALVAAATLVACSTETSRDGRSTDTAIAPSRGAHVARVARGGTASSRESLPRGVKLEGGATIPHTDYVFRRVSTPRGDSLWLDSLSRGTGGATTRVRRAELAVPPLAADERFMLASCDVKGRLDPFVVAIVVNEDNTSRFTKIRQAWRANPKSRAFEIVPVANIVCEDPGS